MTEYLEKWKDKKKELIRIFGCGLLYLLVMAGIFFYYNSRAGGSPAIFMMVVILVSAAAAAIVCYLTIRGSWKEADLLYQELSGFTDTVLFAYNYHDGRFHFTPNASAQMELPLFENALDKYVKSPPKQGEVGTFEFRMKSVDEEYHWCVCHVRVKYGKEGKPTHLIGKLDDISKQKKREEQLLLQSTRDGLTGVYNKTAFEYMMEEVLKRGSVGCLYMIDIDNFKEVNDQFGHPAGDKILIKVGELLQDIFRDSDLIGRVGGDEFVVYSESDDIGPRAQNLLNAVSEVVPEEGHCISVSIGIAGTTGNQDEEYRELFTRADQAMYRAKQAGKNRIARYEDVDGGWR